MVWTEDKDKEPIQFQNNDKKIHVTEVHLSELKQNLIQEHLFAK